MSGPKIIDIAATRHAERMRIFGGCRRLEVLQHQYSGVLDKTGVAAGGVDFSILEEVRTAAEASQNITELTALREQITDQIGFVRSETKRLRDMAINTEVSDGAMTRSIERFRKTERSAEVRALLDQASSAQTAAEKMKLFDLALEKSESQDAMKSDFDAIRAWIQELDSEGAAPAELPKSYSQRWHIELDRMRAECAILDAGDVNIEAEISRIESQTDETRRAQLLDEIRLTLVGKLQEARARNQRKEQVEEWMALLETHKAFLDYEHWRQRLENDESVTNDEVESAVDEAVAKESAAVARREVLNSLESLGYEIRPGMETAFVENGKVVVHKARDRDFGVELSGMPNGAPTTMRTRVVRTAGEAAATDSERLRDKEQEVSWCDDRKAMQVLLEKTGVTAEIKASRAAGEIPVPVVRIGGDRRAERSGLRSRTR